MHVASTIPKLPPTPVRTPLVEVYDYSSGSPLPASPDDPQALEALAVADAQARWYADEFGHRGLDGKGTPFRIGVHASNGGQYLLEDHTAIAKSEGDSRWKPAHLEPEFWRHEFAHGIIAHAAPMAPGAKIHEDRDGAWSTIHEAFGMVLQTVADDDWKIQEDQVRPDATPREHVPYDIGTVEYARVGDIPADAPFPGPAMFRKLTTAHAAVIAAETLGRDVVGKVWFDTAARRLDASMHVDQAATATVASAQDQYGEQVAAAVRDAWIAVGITPYDRKSRT